MPPATKAVSLERIQIRLTWTLLLAVVFLVVSKQVHNCVLGKMIHVMPNARRTGNNNETEMKERKKVSNTLKTNLFQNLIVFYQWFDHNYKYRIVKQEEPKVDITVEHMESKLLSSMTESSLMTEKLETCEYEVMTITNIRN